MLPGRFELTPTHGQVHIPMSTKASEMCLHATPTVSRAASNDHHMLTFWLLPTKKMEPTDEFKLVSRIMNRLEIRIEFNAFRSSWKS